MTWYHMAARHNQYFSFSLTHMHMRVEEYDHNSVWFPVDDVYVVIAAHLAGIS